jgi:Ca2+-transporting ATPase
MGLVGTDVAREAADIVLLDDNFATIVEAVRYGRAVVANIAKFITYILASNVPEIAPFLAMVAFRIPAALTVLQILAVDLGTDLLPALGLGAEPPEAGIMRRRPRRRDQPLLDRRLMARAYGVLGLTEAACSMAAYLLAWRAQGIDWVALQGLAPALLRGTAAPAVQAMQHQASAAAFSTIVLGQFGVLLACRSTSRPVLAASGLAGLVANPLLLLGIAWESLLTASLVLVAPLAALMEMAPFPTGWLIWMLLAPLLIVLVDDLRKRRALG